MIAHWLTTLETRLAQANEEELAEAIVSIAYVAAAQIAIPDEDLRPASRRAMLLLAAGGDPLRGLDLDGRAVVSLANDLSTPDRLDALARGLGELADQARQYEHVRTAVQALQDEPDIAWRAYAAALLAEQLGEDQAQQPS
jgi:hypothetical protein